MTSLSDPVRTLVHPGNHNQQMPILLHQFCISVHDLIDLGIRHSFITLDHGRIDLVSAVFANIHLRGNGKTIFLRIQRTNAVAEHLRQHRYDTVCHIDAGTAAICLLIKCCMRSDIIRNIRDMNP